MRALRAALFALVAVSLAIAISTPASAQQPREKVDQEIIAKIKEEGLQRSRAMETLSFLTDVYGPRLTASPRARKAAEWAQAKLTQWGLANSHLEPWGPFGRGWSLEGFTANMVEPTFAPLLSYPKAWSPSTPKLVRGTPIYLEAANEKDLDKYHGKLNHAIVLLSGPREVKPLFDPPARRQSDETLLALANGLSPRSSRQSTSSTSPPLSSPPTPGSPFGRTPEQRAADALLARKWQLIYDEGAAVVLEPSSLVRRERVDGGTVFVDAARLPTRGTGTEENRSAGEQPNPSSRGPRPWAKDAPPIVPQIVVAAEHYNRLVRMLQKNSPIELEIDIASRYYADDLMSYNIIAEIPGGDLADEVVMLGGHFDSWHAGTGATDNAVGCGVALEAVRILQAIGVKPRRTIRIALWTGEEQGLLGSKAYVAEHFGRAINPPQGGRGSGRGGGGSQSRDNSPPTKYELKAEHAKLAAYFNLDNGTGKVRGVYLQGNEAVRPIFRAWLTPFTDMGASTLSPSNTTGTDHLSFDGVGLPGFQFIQDPLEYDSRTHHSSMDVYDRLQEDDVKQASVIMATFVYHAAMRDEKLPRKPLAGEIIPPVQQQ